jgi:Ribbon-helix-helix protein, copG family
MSILTIRMPDATHARLLDLARARGVSMSKLIEEMAAVTLSTHDAEVRFRLMAARGKSERGLAILRRLDAVDRGKGQRRRKAAKRK